MRRKSSTLVLLTAFCLQAEDRWGNNLSPNSVSSARRLPSELTASNLLWEVRLGSHQYSIPTIDRGKVYLGINDAGVQHDGYQPSGGGAVVCLDLKTGNMDWTLPVPRVADGTTAPNYFDHWKCGICSGPVVVGDRIYLVGNRGDVLCLDRKGQANGNAGPFVDEHAYMGLPDRVTLTPQDGDIVWRFDFRKECSVLVHDTCGSTIQYIDGMLFVCTSNGTDRRHQQPLAPEAPALIVLDAETGALIARDAEEEMGKNILHGNWSSPSAGEVNGLKLVFFTGGDGVLYAFERPSRSKDGRVQHLKKVWQADCNPPHFRVNEQGEKKIYSTWQNKRPDGPSEAIGTPVCADGRVYIATGQSPVYGLGAACLTCFDAQTGQVVWRTERVNRTLATIALQDGVIYLPDQNNTLHAFDAKTGETLWTHDLTSTVCYANALVADGKVYIGTERGDFWILKAGRQKEVLFHTRLPSAPVTVVATDGLLLVPLQNRIQCYRAADHTAELTVSKTMLASQGITNIVFVKRNTYTANHYYTEYINSAWLPGGNVCVLDVETGKVRDVVTGLGGGVFERFDLSYDAKRIVFAWKGHPEQGYRIYEVNVDGTGLRQLTFPQADEAELTKKYRTGYHHGTDDMQPCYLPDGSIAFVSTRCQFGILCDTPDNFTTTVLHRMDADGKNMKQLSRGSVSETMPSIMPDGRILYTRWEYVDKGAVSVKCLWAMRPDGTASSEVYGNDIALPPTLNMGRVIPGAPNQYVVCGVPHYPNNNFGTVIRLDMNKNIRTREPMTYMTPQVDVRGEGGWEFMDTETGKWRGNGNGLGPLFSEPYPLSMNSFLVSYKPLEEGPANQANGYGLYLLNDKGGTTLLYRDPEISCWRAIPLVPRKVPPVLASPRNKELAAKNLAQCMVQNVYHGLSGVAPRTIKYIRVLEQMGRPWAAQMARVPLPNGKTARFPEDYDQQHICVSKDTALGLKVQHGIVPVETDGSANFLVPATGNVFFQILDEHYMAVQTERTFVNYMPGESRACIGCHETPEDATRYRESESSNKGQPLAFKRNPSVPGPQPGEKQGGRPLHYEADVQPVFDRHCVSCHAGKEPKGGMNLSGERTRMFSVSYESLVPERRRGPYFDRGVLGLVVGENHPKTGNVSYLPAYSLGSTTALLSGIMGCPTRAQDPKGLVAKHAEVAKKITQEERLRVTNWIDTNCQYYGSYWYRRNKDVFGTHPDFRRVPTYEDALRTSVP